ncbi:hypothetical protein GLOIN_2v1873907 [Rhizophagus clarus]|uniref:Uncharacterized protein n=1 Tax=Rhizophagus clarus TaxID=94130 RepID=A0A8H3KYT3_9GLOM|nr:hypothetical protein GLOIN_2v1873907 [Rhizophagus clarus]
MAKMTKKDRNEMMPSKKTKEKHHQKPKMQQILKVFIVLAFIVAVIATPVPMQKRQGTPKCPPPPNESTESDTYPVYSTGDGPLMPYDCSP